MRCLLALILTVAVAAPVAASDLGAAAPDKPVSLHPPPPPDPEVIRQGGDTIADAVTITLPVINGTGSTAGYNDDYYEVCPYLGTPSPDVVYTFIPDYDMSINVNTLGSAYDTLIYIYAEDLDFIACNDDFWPDYTSFMEDVFVAGGARYFLIIDGYGGESGDYLLNITEYVPCELTCPDGAAHEGEPPLITEYVDNYNGGCSTEGEANFQSITSEWFCGVSGFYMSGDLIHRDTDWFTLVIPATGMLEIIGDAELLSRMCELGPQDCNTVGVVQQVSIGPCAEGTMTIVGAEGSTVWFWVGPQNVSSPGRYTVYEYDYVLWFSYSTVATENHSWSNVKSLFR